MISRRQVLQGGALTAMALALPFARPRRAFAGTPTTFDYYISVDGDDSNPGTLSQPWSITALNAKMTIYAGKSIGIIGNTSANPTVINAGRAGGVITSLYSLYQNLAGNLSGGVLMVNGGTSASSPTYLATCDSSGVYSPRTAVIDASDPSTGALPTVQGGLLTQNAYQSSVIPPNLGNVTVDGLVIRNFTFSALLFWAESTMSGVTIQNCDLYDGQNVVSNNNPGAIYFDGVVNGNVQNCLIHDVISNASGTSSNMQACGFIQFNSSGTTIKNCTFYNCCAISNKDGWQSMNVSYCYCGWGTFGSPYSYDPQYSNLGGTIQNYLCGSGETVAFHHNIVLGPLLATGESNQANAGTVLIYNNTFYKPAGIGGKNAGLTSFTDLNTGNNAGGTGTFEFYNNIVYAEDGRYADGYGNPAAFGKMGASTGGTWSTLTNCDYNAYGSGMTFGQSWVTGDFPWPLSKWQGYSYDKNSTILTESPFGGGPSEADYATFTASGPATTAGKGGGVCGAVDGSGPVGCDFATLPRPSASTLSGS